MDAPAPSLPPPPAPPPPPPPPPSGAPTTPRDHTERAARDPFRPAPVLAGIGTFLLTAAAISFVAARWDRFDPGERFGVLLAASAVAFAAWLALRRVAPATTRALDVLIAALAPVDVAALTVVTGASWPSVAVAGGVAAIVSAEVLRARDPAGPAAVGTIVGGVLAACGIAVTYDIPVVLLLAGLGALGCLATPWNRERVAGPVWAALAGLAPAFRVLDDADFTGSGTMADLALLRPDDWQATLAAGVIATVALAVAAVLRRSLLSALLSIASAAATGVAMWEVHQPPQSVLVLSLAILVVLAELSLASGVVRRFLDSLPTRDDSSVYGAVVDGVAVISGVLSVAAVATALDPDIVGGSRASGWAYAAAVLSLGWVVSDVRRGYEAGHRGVALLVQGGAWAPATWAASTTALAAVVLAVGVPTAGWAALGLAAVLLCSGRAGRLSIAWFAGVLAPVAVAPSGSGYVAAALGIGLVIAVSVMVRPLHGTAMARQSVIGMVVPLAVGALSLTSTTVAGAALFAVVALWLAAIAIDVADPAMATAMRGGALIVAVAPMAEEPRLAIALLLGSAAGYALHASMTRQRGSVLLGGWSLAAAGLALFVSIEPGVAYGVGGATFGLTLVALGWDHQRQGFVFAGLGIAWYSSLVALASVPVTIAEPYLYPVLLGLTGLLLMDRRVTISPWVIVSFPVLIAGTAAVAQRIESGNAGHTVFFGVVMVLLALAGAIGDDGSILRKAALIVGAAATVAVGAYESLAAVVGIESWSWLVVSGSAAMTVAALLEVTERASSD